MRTTSHARIRSRRGWAGMALAGAALVLAACDSRHGDTGIVVPEQLEQLTFGCGQRVTETTAGRPMGRPYRNSSNGTLTRPLKRPPSPKGEG